MTHGGFKSIAGLTRILSDQSGNVAIIAAASLIPLMAMIGGGIDTGRAYMAKTQLQSACDAGVLAGRRAMGESGDYGDVEKAKAQKMFAFNFDASAVEATDVNFETVDEENGQVSGTATATLPTVVMKIFGKKTLDISTDCSAELQIANADVMFVLDTTGSMGGSKIAGLREAVLDFHKTMNGAVKDENTRVRYGFVPYSMTVNARDLVASGEMPTSSFVDSNDYETRKALFDTIVYVPFNPQTISTTSETQSVDDSKSCTNWADNYGNNPVWVSGSKPGKVREKYYSKISYKNNTKTCKRSVEVRDSNYVTKYGFTKWQYLKEAKDVSGFKNFTSIPVATGVENAYADVKGNWYSLQELAAKNGSELHGVDVANTSWNGCLEERKTVTNTSWKPIPSGAFDLDLDGKPTSDDTRWRPMWPQITYARDYKTFEENDTVTKSPANAACPAPMMLFKEVELSDNVDDIPEWLSDYVNGLIAQGNTYHDLGMIWGGRLSSSRGIFADNVNLDDKAVSRHLIFMTDGKMEPDIDGYNAYGVEVVSNRVAPFGTSLSSITARHTARFLAACDEVKSEGTTVWVIAFGTTLTKDLKTCSSDGRAYESNNTDDLKKTFKYIASQVANLRLSQ